MPTIIVSQTSGTRATSKTAPVLNADMGLTVLFRGLMKGCGTAVSSGWETFHVVVTDTGSESHAFLSRLDWCPRMSDFRPLTIERQLHGKSLFDCLSTTRIGVIIS